ncbi:MAG: molybdopterin-dependent oxidoreductase [Planctomycetes bacterium]|nr:molybdopterin-dependent oxidoreductase [Planctomycetota bacterium]
MHEEQKKEQHRRREFLKSSALLGAAGAAVCGLLECLGREAEASALDDTDYEYQPGEAENIIYSACLQCHTACPIKCKLYRTSETEAVLVKIDGNPYCPQALFPNVPYKDDLAKAAKVDGKICPKGQAGIQTNYDPYRLRKVLKRVGPRASGKWKTMEFNDAIKEICNGGNLFGEGEVKGLKDLCVLRDPAVAKAMADDVALVKKKKMTVAEFKAKHKANLDVLIDPDHPDLGPKNNRFVFQAGRIEHGRKELMKRFTNDSFGSINCFEHTTICEQSHHIGYQQTTHQYKDGKWQKGKHHMKPDFENAEYVIFFGTGVSEANFGPPLLAGLTSNASVEHNFKYAVVDPRLSRTAGKADTWIPIKPGTDAAFALGMIRWIIANKRYDAKFLRNANKAAATAAGETAWSTSTLLVKLDNGRPAVYLRAKEIGIGTEHQLVAMQGDKPVAVNPSDEKSAIQGDLLAEFKKDGIEAKTAFQCLKERAFEKEIKEYAEICGVAESDIVDLAREFTSHGKKAAAEFYRGPVQHTNGYHASRTLVVLNVLIGNSGWKGGLTEGGGHYHETGGKDANPYNFKKMHPNKLTAFGIRSNREKDKYEETTLFEGYPNKAKRPFFPFTGNLYQEIIPSAGDGYPYSIGCLFLHKGTPVFSSPVGHKLIAILKDTSKIPLFIASDIVIGETSMYADYIIPDRSVWERWGTPHTTPAVLTTVSKVRQPVVAPATDIVKVDGHEMPICMETFLIAVGKQLGLSGFGADGFGKGMAFNRIEDWFLKAVVNMAMGDKLDENKRPKDAVPEADEKEMALFVKARRHLPKAVFDPERWKKAAGEKYWRRAVYVLNRGGHFMDWEKRYKGNVQQHAWKGHFNLFCEPVAMTKNTMTGEYFDGLPKYEPVTDAKGNRIKDTGFDMHLITFKDILGGHSRTRPADPWLREILMINPILLNRQDANRLGIKKGDAIRVKSQTNPEGCVPLGDGANRTIRIEGKVEVIEGIRPGVVAVPWHRGHWAYGSHDVEIDGQLVKGDPSRGGGPVVNPAFREDTSIGNVCLTDPIGGSASFYDTFVKIEKV